MICGNARCGPSASADRTVAHARAAPTGRTDHGSGITAALHWHRTPATGALIFLFLSAAKRHFQLNPGQLAWLSPTGSYERRTSHNQTHSSIPHGLGCFGIRCDVAARG